ncbi:MAG: hydroxysqualene dehydroxylase HpnE [Acidimicrobiales bacterium]
MTGPGGRSGGAGGPGGRSGGAGGPRVIVVGGGLAGLSAGLACADAGAAVTLLECRPRLGGATWSFRRGDRWFDNGQHVFLRCCTAYRGFLDRIGSTAGTRLQERLTIPVLTPGGRPGWIRRTSLPVPLHLAAALAGYRHLGLADRARLGPVAVALSRLDLSDPTLDRVTFGAWLAARGQGERAVAALWNLITQPTVNLPASRASLAMAAKVFQTGLLSGPDAADIGWARVPLAHLHGDPARAALERAGADVRLRARVDVIEVPGTPGTSHANGSTTTARPAGPAVVVDGERLLADSVILAVPHDAAAQLLPPGSVPGQERLPELGTSPVVDVHVVYDRRVTDLELAAGLGTPVQWLFDRTSAAAGGRAAGGRADPAGQVLAVSLSAADEWVGRRPEELIDTFVAALAQLLPRARSARVLDAVVSRERAATFAATPGSAALRPGPRTATPGLVLAGAWTDTGWPATMEGAVRSGLAAAHQALAHTGLTRGLPAVPHDRPAWLSPSRPLWPGAARRAGGRAGALGAGGRAGDQRSGEPGDARPAPSEPHRAVEVVA